MICVLALKTQAIRFDFFQLVAPFVRSNQPTNRPTIRASSSVWLLSAFAFIPPISAPPLVKLSLTFSYNSLVHVTFRFFLPTATKPKMRSHYRGHKMALWLNLIPQLHRPGDQDVSMRHHHFREREPHYYAGECSVLYTNGIHHVYFISLATQCIVVWFSVRLVLTAAWSMVVSCV